MGPHRCEWHPSIIVAISRIVIVGDFATAVVSAVGVSMRSQKIGLETGYWLLSMKCMAGNLGNLSSRPLEMIAWANHNISNYSWSSPARYYTVESPKVYSGVPLIVPPGGL